jgi:O-antigen chain-terminating methyltransferase
MASNGVPNPKEVIAAIRERVRARHAAEPEHTAPCPPAAASLTPAPSAYDLRELHANLAACNALHAAVGTLNPRSPGLHNQALQFVKKVMRRSLTWYTRPLHEFQGAATRTLNETTIALEEVRSGLALLQSRLDAIAESLYSREQGLEQTVSSQGDSIRSLQRDLRRLQDQVVDGERAAHKSVPAGQPQMPATATASPPGPELDFDYFMFEERFRGPESEIKRRQQAYLEYFRGCAQVLDLGCGRGEFLELMRENAIPAHGVETGKDALLLCREKGLSVTKANLLSYLESQADRSIGGIFSSQVIEHLRPAAQMQMVRLAHHKLTPGSPLLIETINPECVYALCRNFYLDPTHVRPVHPEMLAFVMQSLGFERVDIKYSSPVSDRQVPRLPIASHAPEVEAFNQGISRVNDLLFGFQDYAAIGWK